MTFLLPSSFLRLLAWPALSWLPRTHLRLHLLHRLAECCFTPLAPSSIPAAFHPHAAFLVLRQSIAFSFSEFVLPQAAPRSMSGGSGYLHCLGSK